MYPRGRSQFDIAENVGISMFGRWEPSGGEPWLTMASGNGSRPGGRSTLVWSLGPVRVASPTISWAAVSTVTAGAAVAGNGSVECSGSRTRTATRRRRTLA
jgi:hypothetical protein